ncbi:hypothetical protein FLAG1_07305 [Fusarium langsethiae]|uniref:Uncharacterized protein n=1 Tax=Fusarium langsethiae TaxID=179993 RepID=A0A0N0DDL5_FUSLA|nr:hypothetical protein FLAG1_07305 [Fusarium langsethiae]
MVWGQLSARSGPRPHSPCLLIWVARQSICFTQLVPVAIQHFISAGYPLLPSEHFPARLVPLEIPFLSVFIIRPALRQRIIDAKLVPTSTPPPTFSTTIHFPAVTATACVQQPYAA